MSILVFLLRESWWQVILAIACGLLSGSCSARLIALINSIVSDPTMPGIVPQFIGLSVVVLTTAPMAQYLLIHLSEDAIYQLRIRLCEQILMAPLQHLETLGSPRLLASLTADIMKLSNTVFIVPFICIDISIVLGCLTYLAVLSRLVFLFTLLMIFLGLVTSQFLLRRSRQSMRKARDEQDQLFKHFRTLTEGIKELKLHQDRRQDYLTNQLAVSANHSRRYAKTGRVFLATTTAWGNFLFFLIIGSLLLILPRLIILEPLVLSGFVLTMTYLMVPFKNLTERIPQLMDMEVALQKIAQLGFSLADQTEDLSLTLRQPMTPFHRLELREVFHTYRGEATDEEFSLGPVNLSFHPGEIVFIVGGNGSGKSTLAKVITSLYMPEQGQLLLNGEVVTDQNQAWYRQYFTGVFSDFYLFDNLLGSDRDQTERQARRYLKRLYLDHKVDIQHNQFSTLALSQGQRKRLALLTVYLDDRPIYLFDEWAADQDPRFRAVFYEEILPDLRNRGNLVIAITHDDRYFHLADRVIKLNYGRIESIQFTQS